MGWEKKINRNGFSGSDQAAWGTYGWRSEHPKIKFLLFPFSSFLLVLNFSIYCFFPSLHSHCAVDEALNRTFKVCIFNYYPLLFFFSNSFDLIAAYLSPNCSSDNMLAIEIPCLWPIYKRLLRFCSSFLLYFVGLLPIGTVWLSLRCRCCVSVEFFGKSQILFFIVEFNRMIRVIGMLYDLNWSLGIIWVESWSLIQHLDLGFVKNDLIN